MLLELQNETGARLNANRRLRVRLRAYQRCDTRERSLAYIGHGFTAASFKRRQAGTHYDRPIWPEVIGQLFSENTQAHPKYYGGPTLQTILRL